MKPSYEELEAKLIETEAKLAETQRLLKLALERIARLEERLNKNSKNSSKPPSSDHKPNSSGGSGQRRHREKGFNRAAFPQERVDHFVTCSLESCPHCSAEQLTNLQQPMALQQVDLPEVKAIVTQFNCTKYHCTSCGKTSFAKLPTGVPNSSFGPKLMGLIATLTGFLHLAKRDAIQLVKDLYGIEICEGSIINVEERVSAALDGVYDRIHRHVMQSVFCKHFDETSWRDRGKTHQVWVGSTSSATCFHIDPSRSKAAFQRFAKSLTQAPVVTDRYNAYKHLSGPHQYCLAHLIRDFRKYAAREGPDGDIGESIEKLLRKVCRTHRDFREKRITRGSRGARLRHQKKQLEDLLLDGLANGSDELSGLCDRLLDCFHKLWTFSRFNDVEPTNNLAERDLRKVVLWRKKSYGTRSKRGQRFVERIASVTQTLKKQGLGVLSYVQAAVLAHYRGKSAPLINASGGY